MSRIRAALERRNYTPPDTTEYGGTDGYPASSGYWSDGMVWRGDASSTSVSVETAMLSSAVFACLRLLSEGIATLPMDAFRREDAGRVEVELPTFLRFLPPGLSRIDYLSQLVLSLLTNGNAYVALVRDGGGAIVSLVVLDPTKVQVRRTNGVVTYLVGSDVFTSAEVMHIPGMLLPGAIVGVSPIKYARETLALDRDARRFGQSFFANGALPGAVIEAPGEMTRDAAEMFRETWNGSHQGVGNAHRIGVLTEGAKLTTVSVTPEDSQFLETRQFSIPDLARIYGVPPHLIGDATNSTSWGSGLAEQNVAFGQFSLRPWTERLDLAHTRLLASEGMAPTYIKLNLDGLLRASLKDRYEAAAIGIASGFLTRDEARGHEDLPPLPAAISKEQADALGSLVRSGFEPAAACAAIGIDPIAHTGSLPVTVQAEAK